MTTKIIEIIAAGLQSGGYGGLVQPGICGCVVGELSPGVCFSGDCEPGYKHTHSRRPDDWIVSTKKDGVTDGEIECCISDCG